MPYLYGITTADATPHNSPTNLCQSCGGGTARLIASRLCGINLHGQPMSTLQEIEKAIETLPLPERLRLYKEMPQLIGRGVEDLDWQRLALERFFQDDSPEDDVYDRV
jgi:hypothetical protein